MGEQSEFTLQDYLNIFLRRWWIVALATIISLGLAVIWTSQQTPMYRSTATVLVNQSNASEIFDPVTGTAGSNAGRLTENEARFVRSSLVSEEAIRRLGFNAGASVSTESNADVLVISGTSDDPAQAQQIAQTYAETYIDVRKDQFVAERLETANKLFSRIEDLDTQIAAATGADKARLELLRSQLADSFDLLSLTASLAEGTGAQIIDAANRPTAPFTPLVGRNVMLGGVLGVLIGSGLVLLAESLDRSVKSREVLEALTPGAPNLAIIPTLGKFGTRPDSLVALHDTSGTSAEAFRTLRAALQYVAVDDSVQVLQIVSAHSAAGKTTIAANLAITLAQAGQTVAVVDADLRRPRLHQLFGVPQVPGLTSAIIGAAAIEQCIHTVGEGVAAPYVVPSGPVPPGPSELLGSAAGARVFEQIRRMVDVVIIDTPPVLPVADTIVLSRYVDASVLVVDAQSTTRADVVLAFERLEQAGAPVIGTVLNKVKARGAFGYGYGYGYGYGQEPDQNKGGLIGWFSNRNEPIEKVETLSGAQIPRIELAPKTAKRGAAAAQSGNRKNGASPTGTPARKASATNRTPAAPTSARPASPSAGAAPAVDARRVAERRSAASADTATASFAPEADTATASFATEADTAIATVATEADTPTGTFAAEVTPPERPTQSGAAGAFKSLRSAGSPSARTRVTEAKNRAIGQREEAPADASALSPRDRIAEAKRRLELSTEGWADDVTARQSLPDNAAKTD